MDKRTITTISLCFIIWFAWQKFYLEPRIPAARPGGQTLQIAAAPASNAAQSDKLTTGPGASGMPNPNASVSRPNPSSNLPFQTIPISTRVGTAKVSDGNRAFSDWNLKGYRLKISPEAASVDLRSVTEQMSEAQIAFDAFDISGVRGNLTKTANGALWAYEDANLKLTREATATDQQPYVDLVYTAEFKTKKPSYAFISLAATSPDPDPEGRDRQLVYWTNDSIERLAVEKATETKPIVTSLKWIGTTSRYFLMTLVSEGLVAPTGLIQNNGPRSGRISMVFPVNGNSITIPLRAYFGPKELEVLRAVEPTLDHTVDLGWFTIFAYPLLKLMKGLYGIFHNYGIAIILLTILVKLATYPLTYKSMKSMKEMAKLQPQIARLRERYKDDKEAQNREMITLMKTHGYNPVAGCLPILVQMPIFFALYRVLYSSIELYQAPFALWLQDLSAKDPFYITPVLMTLTMFIQQKLTPNTATDPAQARMMQFMPLMFGAFMLTLPSGLTLYMLVNALASILQQLILNKKLGGPVAAARPVRA